MTPKLITHTHESGLTFTVIGGVPPQQPGQLVVTVCISGPDVPHIYQNVDLFDFRSVNQLCLFTRLRRTPDDYHAGMSALITLVVQYQEEQHAAAAAPPPTGDEKLAATGHLRQEDLMEQTMDDLQELGICGERENSVALYLSMASAHRGNPLNVLCRGRSGTGKAYLVNKVAACMPAGMLYTQDNPEGSVYLLQNMGAAPPAIGAVPGPHTRGLTDEPPAGRKRGRPKAVMPRLCHPVALIGCTTGSEPPDGWPDNTLILDMDGSKEQDSRVMAYRKALQAGAIDQHKDAKAALKLRHILQALHPVKVINPYAPQLELPPGTPNPRQALALLLSLTEVIAWYHQYQRKWKTDAATGRQYIEAARQDADWAFKLMHTAFARSDGLSKSCREFYDLLSDWTAKNNRSTFTTGDIRDDFDITPRTLQRYLIALSACNKIKRTGGDKRTGGYAYTLVLEDACTGTIPCPETGGCSKRSPPDQQPVTPHPRNTTNTLVAP